MPTKHQSHSYRNRKGVRYVCWEDVLELHTASSLKARAREVVNLLRNRGYKSFYEKQDDYFRVFVEERKMTELGTDQAES